MKKIMTMTCLLFCLVLTLNAQNKRSAETLELPDTKNFTGISASLAANIYLRQGDSFSVKATGRSSLLDRLETSVKDSVLRIRLERDYTVFHDLERINIYITAPSFEHLVFSGVGKVISENKLTGKKLYIEHSGALSIDLDVEYATIDAEMSGVGTIALSGKAEFARLEMSGTGSIDAEDLTVQNADCSVSGLGKIHCFAENDLTANVSGLGKVTYRGAPKHLKKSVSGLGKVVSSW
jgi:Putative auto-transporter adhesin, head GIN domain